MYCLLVLHRITVFLYILLQMFTYLFNVVILFKQCLMIVLKGSPGAAVKLFLCDHEVMG
jgi:hypothetical protein